MTTKKNTEKPLKYHELLHQSQQDRDSQDIQFEVDQARLQLESDILATKQSLGDANKALIKAKSARPFKSSVVADCIKEIRELEDGLKIAEDLKAELF